MYPHSWESTPHPPKAFSIATIRIVAQDHKDHHRNLLSAYVTLVFPLPAIAVYEVDAFILTWLVRH
jgi:hypothetical protein